MKIKVSNVPANVLHVYTTLLDESGTISFGESSEYRFGFKPGEYYNFPFNSPFPKETAFTKIRINLQTKIGTWNTPSEWASPVNREFRFEAPLTDTDIFEYDWAAGVLHRVVPVRSGLGQWLPQSPFNGPPLPQFLNLLWPWVKARA